MTDELADFYIQQKSLKVPIGEIALSIFGREVRGSKNPKSAAYQRLRRLVKSGFDESKPSTIKAGKIFDEGSSLTQAWITPKGRTIVKHAAVREDKITIEELRYLSQIGHKDTQRTAKRLLKNIAKELGVKSYDLDDKLVVDRPTVKSKAGGVEVEYLFGRRRSDIQRAKIRAQLRALGIKWSEDYADFAGYGGI